jgi:hypothetical protein
MNKWQTAETLARELFELEMDVSEFQKVIAFARTHLDGAKVFTLIDTMVLDGQHLVRSGRTLDYYHDLQEVCSDLLRDYRRATGSQAEEMVSIMAWAARLMRYYDTDAGNEEFNQAHRTPVANPPKAVQQQPTTIQTGPKPFTGTRERQSVTLPPDPKPGKPRVVTADGAVISCPNLPVYVPSQAKGCIADVRFEKGQAVSAKWIRWT